MPSYAFRRSVLGFSAALVLCAAGVIGGEPAPKAPDQDLSTLEAFRDVQAGYSLRLPSGYRKMSEDENRKIVENISQYIGKEAADRVDAQPPAYFKGPIDDERPKTMPPTLTISYASSDEPFETAKLAEYQQRIENTYKKSGLQYSDLKLEIVKIDGVNALRFENEAYSPVDNTRVYKLAFHIPGQGRRYDIVFDCLPFQTESVKAAADVIMKTFKIETPPLMDAATQGKWTRVALWTAGGFVVGILLSVLIKVLSRSRTKSAQPA
jgi:hypothetical protein